MLIKHNRNHKIEEVIELLLDAERRAALRTTPMVRTVIGKSGP